MKMVVFSCTALFGLSSCGYNDLQGIDEEVKASWGEVQNQYQRRSDLIPNLVETVKGYAKHEQGTLEGVVEARAKATAMNIDASKLSDPAALKRFQEAQGQLTTALGKLMVLKEAYPDLKANQNFLGLQAQLEGTENRITVARKRFIDTVAEYNKKVRFFPTNLTAKFMLHMEPKATFEAEASAATAPKVQF
ncbi:MAG: LemA family protein [Cryobacterium sp.]|nr:LemA family protein [Oligoflexia bacterium]